MARIERATSPLPRECSTTELHGRFEAERHSLIYWSSFFGAGEGNRTLVLSLEGFGSTIELHPPLVKVRLPLAFRVTDASPRGPSPVYGLVEGEGFEPSKAEPTDLQSAPFDRSGTPPNETGHYSKISVSCQTTYVLWHDLCSPARGVGRRPAYSLLSEAYKSSKNQSPPVTLALVPPHTNSACP